VLAHAHDRGAAAQIGLAVDIEPREAGIRTRRRVARISPALLQRLQQLALVTSVGCILVSSERKIVIGAAASGAAFDHHRRDFRLGSGIIEHRFDLRAKRTAILERPTACIRFFRRLVRFGR